MERLEELAERAPFVGGVLRVWEHHPPLVIVFVVALCLPRREELLPSYPRPRRCLNRQYVCDDCLPRLRALLEANDVIHLAAQFGTWL